MPRLVDITGMQFGTLTASAFIGTVGNGTYWLVVCTCGCGRESVVLSNNLRSGRTKSCRGFNAVAGDKLVDYPHERASWANMMRRCYDTADPHHYKYYGGRGIIVCPQWHKFYFFLQDMGRKPTPKHTIERLDTDGNYEPDNCVWATMLEQRHNRRDSNVV